MIFLVEIVVCIVVAVLILRKLEGAAALAALVVAALAFLVLTLVELGHPREAAKLGTPLLAVAVLVGGGYWIIRRYPHVPGMFAGVVLGAMVGVPLFVAVLKFIESLGWRDAEQYPTVRIAVAFLVVSLSAAAGGWIGYRTWKGRGSGTGPVS